MNILAAQLSTVGKALTTENTVKNNMKPLTLAALTGIAY